ncbi:MAG: hypothetical protein Q9227_006842 [Pyrenula ochraceoflavens]
METYNGHVRTPSDAILLFEACRIGMLPRVQRRLSEKERQSIRSGSVFVWDEREAGMRRWTDGKSWSASRVSGSFLTYREMEGKRGGNGFAPPVARNGKTPPESNRNSGDDREAEGEEGPDGYRYKPDGLMKQSFSITTSNGQHLHLISYYSRNHQAAQALQQPSSDPNLRHIRPAKGMYPESTVNDQQSVPAVTRSPMIGAPGGYPMPPQPNGYGRAGATHPHSYAPPYGAPPYAFPPSPMSTPPTGYGVPMYAQGAALPPLHNGAPPPMAYGPPMPQGAPMLERIPSREGHLHIPHVQHSNSASPAATPSYPPASSPHPGQTPTLSQTEKESRIDPRLMSPQSGANQSNAAVEVNTPPSLKESPTESKAPDSAQIATTASEVPRIGALVNGVTAGPTENGDNRPSSAGSRSGSRSPGGTKKTEGPTDIPSEKLGFGEDKRALRQLDAHFHRA